MLSLIMPSSLRKDAAYGFRVTVSLKPARRERASATHYHTARRAQSSRTRGPASATSQGFPDRSRRPGTAAASVRPRPGPRRERSEGHTSPWLHRSPALQRTTRNVGYASTQFWLWNKQRRRRDISPGLGSVSSATRPKPATRKHAPRSGPHARRPAGHHVGRGLRTRFLSSTETPGGGPAPWQVRRPTRETSHSGLRWQAVASQGRSRLAPRGAGRRGDSLTCSAASSWP